VVDRKGKSITDLAAADFQVWDEGQPQQISYFGRESEPLDLLLLLDVSGSMRKFLQEMASTAKLALAQLNASDQVGIMFFARNQRVQAELTGNLRDAEAAIQEATKKQDLGAGTTINASILEAAKYIASKPVRGRRAILIVTDNQGLNYMVPDEEVLRELYAADAVLNAIVSGDGRGYDEPKPGSVVNPDFTPPDVYKLAAATGGEALAARRAKQAFQEMIERIRARYSLQYPAPEAQPGTFRTVKADLTPEARRKYPDAVVRARGGYYPAP
jgi:VWFA-related protein